MAQVSKSARRVPHTFLIRAPGATCVRLVGAFNGWDAEATAMRRNEYGQWTATLELAPGRYEYKYVVDGRWRREDACEESDRGCPHCVPNAFGSMNCVLNLV